MNVTLFIATLLTSGFIVFQDLKSRQINLLLTLGFISLIISRYFILNTAEQIMVNALFCLLYFLLSYVILRLYYFLKTAKTQKIIDSKIGWGDIILLYAIGCTIEPEKLVVFFSIVFISSLIFHVFILRDHKQVPLAAYLLIFYSTYLVIDLY